MLTIPVTIQAMPTDPSQVWMISAAVVQAVGSVLAIIAAGFLAFVPLNEAKKLRAREHNDRLDSFEQAFDAAMSEYDVLISALNRRDVLELLAAWGEYDKVALTAYGHYSDLKAPDWPSHDAYVTNGRAAEARVKLDRALTILFEHRSDAALDRATEAAAVLNVRRSEFKAVLAALRF